jgi:uncharacterized peroxidase-related enzyme
MEHLQIHIGDIPMPTFPVTTLATAPEKSKPVLEQLQKGFGFIPNLAAVIATSPKLVTAFAAVFQQVHSGSFTEPEIQIVLLTDAVTNGCEYAVAFHTALAHQAGVNAEETDAVRAGRLPKDARLAALSALARTFIEKRGHVSVAEQDAFLAAGFASEQILEVITIVAASTITNYAGAVGQPPLEDKFQQYAWRG